MPPQMIEVLETAPASRTFYSRTGNLIINIRPSRKVLNDQGKAVELPGKHVEFSPQHDNFGRLVTDDLEVIEALEKRDDVMDHNRYIRESTPPEKLAEMAINENQKLQREIQSQNELIAKLRAEGKLPK